MLLLRIHEDCLVSTIETLHQTVGRHLNRGFGSIAIYTFVLFVFVILLGKIIVNGTTDTFTISVFSVNTCMFIFCVFVLVKVLIHFASVHDTFHSMAHSIFRGYPCWQLSITLGGEPLLLQQYMADLGQVFAIRLMGLPVTYSLVHGIVGTIIVGLVLTLMVPLLQL